MRAPASGAWTGPSGRAAPSLPPVCQPVGYLDSPLAMTAGDLNGDGRQDLVWLEYGSGSSPVGRSRSRSTRQARVRPDAAVPVPDRDTYVNPWRTGTPGDLARLDASRRVRRPWFRRACPCRMSGSCAPGPPERFRAGRADFPGRARASGTSITRLSPRGTRRARAWPLGQRRGSSAFSTSDRPARPRPSSRRRHADPLRDVHRRERRRSSRTSCRPTPGRARRTCSSRTAAAGTASGPGSRGAAPTPRSGISTATGSATSSWRREIDCCGSCSAAPGSSRTDRRPRSPSRSSGSPGRLSARRGRARSSWIRAGRVWTLPLAADGSASALAAARHRRSPLRPPDPRRGARLRRHRAAATSWS